jgi:putative membrane protein
MECPVLDAWQTASAALLTASAGIYAGGVARLWRNAGRGRGLRPLNIALFAAGLAAAGLALVSPFPALSQALFSAHMGQHELLMLVAAPLLVMGKPWLAAAWALPARSRAGILAVTQRPLVRGPFRALTAPATVLVLHALALWIWHVPQLFERALENQSLHAFQHFCFFGTAALFWWTLVQGRYGRAGYGAGVLFVFLTSMHSGILGALMTLGRTLWYPAYDAPARAAGIDPLRDQQLAGLIMWIPAGIIFMVVGLALCAAWLGESERRGRLSARSHPL